MSISLIVPAFNEEDCLEETVRISMNDLSAVADTYEILIINDGSNDRTAEIADRLAQEYDCIRVIHHTRNIGIGYTIREGFKSAGCDLVLSNCADRPFDTKNLKSIISMFNEADIVVAVREDRSANSFYRKITSIVNYYLIQLLFRLNLGDFQFVQIYKKEVLDKLEIESCSAFIPPEMLIKASRLGFRIKEFKAKFHLRPGGKAKCGRPIVILRAVRDIFRFWWRWEIIGKKRSYSPVKPVGALETMVCELCGDKLRKRLYAKNGYSIVRCPNCELVFVENMPSESELTKLYGQSYFVEDPSVGRIAYKDYFSKGQEWRSKFKDELAKIENFTSRGRILDIGCAAGFFMDVARDLGWETYGIELSEVTSNFARDELGLNVITGRLEENNFPPNYFDAVFMGDFLEHLIHLRRVLEEVSRITKDGGILILDTPNIASPTAKFYGRKWVLLAPPYHLFYFTPRTLDMLLQDVGFEILELTTSRTLFHNELQGSDRISSKVVNFLFDNRFWHRMVEKHNWGTKMMVYARKVQNKSETFGSRKSES